MDKNLIIFYGEFRTWSFVYELYRERYDIDKHYDIIVSTWNQNEGNKFSVGDMMSTYPHISFISKEDSPYCGNLLKVENCITYHCKTALDLIPTNHYENIVLCRTDAIVKLHKLDFGNVKEDTIYRWFDNVDDTPDSFMNDLIFIGKPNTVKKFFDGEYTELPNIFKGENNNATDKLLSGVHGVDPTKSVAGVKCVDILDNILTDYDDIIDQSGQVKGQFIGLVKGEEVNFWREWINLIKNGKDFRKII